MITWLEITYKMAFYLSTLQGKTELTLSQQDTILRLSRLSVYLIEREGRNK